MDEFMLGDDILVAPILGPETMREVYLPHGSWKEDAREESIVQVTAE